MTTPPTDELTDERLAAIEDRWTENNMIHGDIYTLTQEVRRLRHEDLLSRRDVVEMLERAEKAEADARTWEIIRDAALQVKEKAEAEVERLRKHGGWRECSERMLVLEAERDRYKEALERIERLEGGIDPTPHEIARDALNQQGDTLSKH